MQLLEQVIKESICSILGMERVNGLLAGSCITGGDGLKTGFNKNEKRYNESAN